MRPLLYVLSFLAVLGLGFWAYRENYTTQSALRDVADLQDEIASLHESLAIQRPEWAHLNRPERLRDLAVFQEAYRLVGLGWIYAPVEWPVIGPLAQVVYRLWARLRLRITGRPDLDTLCAGREAAACRSSPVASS